MKITKNKLKQIIKEELTKVFNERTETETREGTFRSKLLNLVQAWGPINQAESAIRDAIAQRADERQIEALKKEKADAVNKFLPVAKSFRLDKKTAMAVMMAKSAQEIEAILNKSKSAGPAKPAAPKVENECAKLKARVDKLMKSPATLEKKKAAMKAYKEKCPQG